MAMIHSSSIKETRATPRLWCQPRTVTLPWILTASKTKKSFRNTWPGDSRLRKSLPMRCCRQWTRIKGSRKLSRTHLRFIRTMMCCSSWRRKNEIQIWIRNSPLILRLCLFRLTRLRKSITLTRTLCGKPNRITTPKQIYVSMTYPT
jgi:hypothetical protein